jgi:hypothetical protein
MEVARLNYGSSVVSDAESDVGFFVKSTLAGPNSSSVLSFRIPADAERFTDLNSVMLRIELRVLKASGENLDDTDDVFLDFNGIHSLFSSCDVRLNKEIVSSMTSYPYSAALCRFLGSATEVRRMVWESLDGTYSSSFFGKSDIGMGEDDPDMGPTCDMLSSQIKQVAKSKSLTLYGRVYSDFFTSCRQYLPPGVEIGVDLRRAVDNFSLCTPHKDKSYRIAVDNASLYLRRLTLRPSVVPRVLDSLKSGATLLFNRLDTRIMSVPVGMTVVRWLDCLNGAALPNRIYVGFVSQRSLYGSLTQLSTYFENLGISSFNVKLNGRDLLVEPCTTKFVKDEKDSTNPATSDARNGYLSVMDVLNLVEDQSGPVRLSYSTYLLGTTFFALELGKCGEKSGSSGAIDLEVCTLPTIPTYLHEVDCFR